MFQVPSQIPPSGIHLFNRSYLPGTLPLLHLLFPADRFGDVIEGLVPNEPNAPILLTEAINLQISVLPCPPNDIARHAEIERAVSLRGNDVDKGRSHLKNNT